MHAHALQHTYINTILYYVYIHTFILRNTYALMENQIKAHPESDKSQTSMYRQHAQILVINIYIFVSTKTDLEEITYLLCM